MNASRGPDLLGACEVENRYVLDLLVSALGTLNRNYAVAHKDMSDGRGIDVAFIYDADLFTAESQFSHFIVKRSATRDLYASEPYRIIAAETLAYFHERIRQVQNDKNVAVLAMGDFNDEPFSRSLVGYALSDRIRTKVTLARSAKFLNLMWQILGQGIGTHYYNNIPNVLDQFLVSKGLVTGNSNLRAIIDSVEVVRLPEMVKSSPYPAPIRFGRKSSLNLNGFSDHYPIAVQLLED